MPRRLSSTDAGVDLDNNQKMDWFFNEFVYGTQIPRYKPTEPSETTRDSKRGLRFLQDAGTDLHGTGQQEDQPAWGRRSQRQFTREHHGSTLFPPAPPVFVRLRGRFGQHRRPLAARAG